MTLEEIQKMWSEDAQIDDDLLCVESTRIPQLHQKYLIIFNEFSLMKKENEFRYKIMLRDKWRYYKGKAPKEMYKELPFDLKLTTKEEVTLFLEADEDLQKIGLKIEYINQILTYLDSILKMVSNRTYQIKNAIEWQRFKGGF